MKKLIIFGGTGGLGSQLVPLLESKFEVTSVGSSQVDVSDFQSVHNFLTDKEFDIVLNLTGFNYDCFLHKYEEGNLKNIKKQVDINILGTVNIVQNCLPFLRSQGYGRIILMSSVLTTNPVVGTSIYTGCKGFIDSFCKTVALENVGKGINCNSIQLGYFDGGLTYKIPEQVRDNIRESIPSKRWGSIQELFNTVCFLVDTEYITGQNIKVSGGLI